jgi:hypothetical protein
MSKKPVKWRYPSKSLLLQTMPWERPEYREMLEDIGAYGDYPSSPSYQDCPNYGEWDENHNLPNDCKTCLWRKECLLSPSVLKPGIKGGDEK